MRYNFYCFFRYAEYVVVNDAANLIPVPDSLALDVAAILPSGALTAYAAVQRVKPFVEYKLQTTSGGFWHLFIMKTDVKDIKHLCI
jgi:NADPH:quinone reductase-like Zn-dependent oxidoreductase